MKSESAGAKPGGSSVAQAAAAPADVPLVWIDKQGAIILNKSAYVSLSYAEAIELRYDSAKQTLGLRAVPMTQAGAFWVVQRRDGTAFGAQRYVEEWAIYAAAFLERHRIAPRKGRQFTTGMTADILTINLQGEPARRGAQSPAAPTTAPAVTHGTSPLDAVAVGTSATDGMTTEPPR